MADKTQFCVTIDTEGDAAVNPNSTYLGIHAVLPQYLALFDKYGIKATFFVQEDKICKAGSLFAATWKRLQDQGHEIGYHAHGIIPSPQEEKDAVITQGIAKLRDTGLDIVSYRGGRFHMTGPLLHTLEKNGMRFDSSVVPGLREILQDGTERCNHVGAPIAPYFPSYKDHTQAGNSRILELPINRYSSYPPDKWGGMMSGGSKEDILFDYFHRYRKDKIIIMVLHIWGALSYMIRDAVREDRYGKVKKWAFHSLKRMIPSRRLNNGAALNFLENTIQHAIGHKDVRSVTMREAGENWLEENRK